MADFTVLDKQDEIYNVIDKKKAEGYSENELVVVSKSKLHLDDFLANGDASLGLYDIAQQAKAKTVGIGIVVEKSFQDGRQRLEEAGLNVSSLCKVASLKGNQVTLLGENE